MSETYQLGCKCVNCYHIFKQTIKKGVRAIDDSVWSHRRVRVDNENVECPKCGCDEVVKVVP